MRKGKKERVHAIWQNICHQIDFMKVACPSQYGRVLEAVKTLKGAASRLTIAQTDAIAELVYAVNRVGVMIRQQQEGQRE
jgi:hypothetical protein